MAENKEETKKETKEEKGTAKKSKKSLDPQSQSKKNDAPIEKEDNQGQVAVILIRSPIDISYDKRHTLDLLNLNKRNGCVVFEKSPAILGMIKKVKDLVTWGEINDKTLASLKDTKKNNKKNNVYSLHPPQGGFERKGIKVPFNVGGALGYRGDKINDLIKRMLPK